jgi:hypothetical protein
VTIAHRAPHAQRREALAMSELPKSLENWIVQQCSDEGLLRVDMKRRGVPGELHYRVVKRLAAERGLTPGRWRDAGNRTFTRFTMDSGRPRNRATVAGER